MNDFSIIENSPDIIVLERKIKGDSRGFLSRLFCTEELESIGFDGLAQVNHTFTKSKGTIRGLHFQHPPFAEKKLVTCIRGEVWDVIVDIRKNSASFMKSYSINLSEENRFSLLVPEGFAHGFQTLTDNVELVYMHSKAYNSDYEDGLNPFDQKLNILWPESVSVVSERDMGHEDISDFKGIKL